MKEKSLSYLAPRLLTNKPKSLYCSSGTSASGTASDTTYCKMGTVAKFNDSVLCEPGSGNARSPIVGTTVKICVSGANTDTSTSTVTGPSNCRTGNGVME
jgi:hypothetical protein